MNLFEINGRRPAIGSGTWGAPTATVIGDVRIGTGCYIGFGAVIRGDFGTIVIGDGCVIEDNVVIHAARETRIGCGVIVGHLALVHDAEIGDNVLVGMQALVGSRVKVGADTIIAEQSHLRDGTTVDAGQIVAGRPAVPVKKATGAHRRAVAMGQAAYAGLRGRYLPLAEESAKEAP